MAAIAASKGQPSSSSEMELHNVHLNGSTSNDKHLQVDKASLPGRSVSRGYQAMHLTFENLNYTVQVTEAPKDNPRGDPIVRDRQILYDITADVKAGEMTAIMGSSGAGKTTLLNLLSGRIGEGDITGKVLINGHPRTKNFRRQAAYVEQADLLLPNLTVRETLDFTSKLRLPSSVSAQAKRERVEDVLAELGLENCQNTMVGGVMQQGVSGGEKRRTSMGVELITNPNMIMLDEPTSGLDSTTAYRVVHTVKKLARRGRSVLMTIHQPKAKIFAMFDKVILLAQGRLVFFGTPSQALAHFESCGFKCPEYTNPADFFLDVTTSEGDSKESNQRVAEAVKLLESRYREARSKGVFELPDEDALRKLRSPNAVLEEAEDHAAVGKTTDVEVALPNLSDADDGGDAPEPNAAAKHSNGSNGVVELDDSSFSFPNGWVTETALLMERNFLNFRREKMVTVFALIQTVFIGLVLGLVFLDLGNSQRDVQNRSGVLFFLVINQSFQPMFQVITVFTTERPIVRKERAAGSYRVSSYVMAKMISELPLQLFFPFLLSCIVYWMVGLREGADHFFIFACIIIMTAFTAQSLGLLIGSIAPSIQLAQAFAPLTVVVFMLFGGLFLNSADTPVYFIWVKWLSHIRYSYSALMENEFRGTQIEPCDASQVQNGQCYANGDQYLEDQDVELSIGESIAALFAISFAFRLLAYVSLRIRDKPRLKYV